MKRFALEKPSGIKVVLADVAPSPEWSEVPLDFSPLARLNALQEERLTDSDRAERVRQDRRTKVMGALPDLLLAAADGKDIGAEVRKVLGE